jgi:AraC-like DNA-binding protein
LVFPLPLAQGPFLYLYTCLQTAAVPFRKKQLLHFLPLLLSYMLFIPFFLLPFQQKIEVFRLQGQGFETQISTNSYAIYVSGIVYTTLSLIRLLRYRKNLVDQFSNTDKINFNWLLYLIIWVVAIWIIILFVQEDKLIFGAAALFVLWLGYFGIRQVQLFHHNTPQPPLSPSVVTTNPETDLGETEASAPNNLLPVPEPNNVKYQKSTLSEQDASLIHERLKVLLAEQKPFTNPDLTLNDLAKSLQVHPNHLSQVINSKENKNFYDLVNEKRIEEFIRLIAQPAQQQYTFMSVAYDCGFNSKASFNRNFKKYTGLTPTDYLKTAGKQVA